MDKLLQRYSVTEQQTISKDFEFLATRTRKSGKISNGVKEKQLLKWQKYSTDVVITSLQVYMDMAVTPSMNEKYVMGIMRNKNKERGEDYGKCAKEIGAK